jgi:hypothetical protein
MTKTKALIAPLVASLVAGLAACGGGSGSQAGRHESNTTSAPVIAVPSGATYKPHIDPANFVPVVDNRMYPLPVGAHWVFDGNDQGEPEHDEVTVTGEHKSVLGVPVVVVRDTVSSRGEVTEDTRDWYAQDRTGNVWYFGEDTKELDHGHVTSTQGSWTAGVDGAQPGIVMPARIELGASYRQEYLRGEAEDLARNLRTGAEVTVPAGRFDNVVVIREWSPLEPKVIEEKYYAPGVGVVLERTTAGGTGRSSLTSHSQ